MVSVRMPKTLLDALKKLAESEHFLDVSEEVRSIVRERYLESNDPYLYQIKKLRKEIHKNLREKYQEKVRKQVVDQLESIRNKIRQEK
jgi:Arc/MetJ-type ribon-helix-helix transcriptional regulator